MNVNEFVACRTPELTRFVKILEEKKDLISLRLRTPHPIRPGAYNRISANRNTENFSNGPVRAIKHSPFRNCGQFLENTSVAFMKTRKNNKAKLSITNELKEKIISKRDTRTRTERIDLQALINNNNNNVVESEKESSKISKDAKLQRKLSKMKRRRAKRAASRKLAVTKFGYRFVLDRSTGARRTRLYIPCHRFLAKRFKFVDVNVSSSSSSQNGDNKQQVLQLHYENELSFEKCFPSLLHQNGLRRQRRDCDAGELDQTFALRYPHACFTAKTFKKVQKAKNDATCVAFDLSYSLSTVFLGVVSNMEEIADLIKERLFPNEGETCKKTKNAFSFNSIKPIGDGVCFKANNMNEADCCSFVSIRAGISLLIVNESKKSSQLLCFVVFDHNRKNLFPALTTKQNSSKPAQISPSASQHLIFPENDQDDAHEQNLIDAIIRDQEKRKKKILDVNNQNHDYAMSNQLHSPFALMIEGTSSYEKAEVIVKKNIRRISRGDAVAVISFSSASAPSTSLKTMLLDLPPIRLTKREEKDFELSKRYRLFAKLFRDAVVDGGCVPGGVRDM